jgi:hypothetical protein
MWSGTNKNYFTQALVGRYMDKIAYRALEVTAFDFKYNYIKDIQ